MDGQASVVSVFNTEVAEGEMRANHILRKYIDLDQASCIHGFVFSLSRNYANLRLWAVSLIQLI